jgi:hypothetical protein
VASYHSAAPIGFQLARADPSEAPWGLGNNVGPLMVGQHGTARFRW